MQIDMTPILSGDCDLLRIEFPLELDYAVCDVRFPCPVMISGEIVNKSGYMTLDLTAKVSYETECARCLAPVAGELCIPYTKNVAQEGTLEDEDNDDYVFIRQSKLDLDETLLEEIMLEIPTKHLCREDCLGLCPKCGKNLNDGECGCSREKEIDPRLAALVNLIDNAQEK